MWNEGLESSPLICLLGKPCGIGKTNFSRQVCFQLKLQLKFESFRVMMKLTQKLRILETVSYKPTNLRRTSYKIFVILLYRLNN